MQKRVAPPDAEQGANNVLEIFESEKKGIKKAKKYTYKSFLRKLIVHFGRIMVFKSFKGLEGR